jgi:hypothetical protein
MFISYISYFQTSKDISIFQSITVIFKMQTTQQCINVNAKFINIDKLRNEVTAREDRKIKTFEHILDMCYQKIINTNKTSNNCCCTFVCPNLVFGLPLFNLDECIIFIMKKLNEKGFNIHLAIPNKLFISWKVHQHNYSKYLQITPNNGEFEYLSQQNMLKLKSAQSSNQNKYTQSLDDNISNFGLYRFPKAESKQENKSSKNHLFNNSHGTQPSARTKIEIKKNYRPIDDYKHSSNTIYNSIDIDDFRNKIDELFT